MAETATCRAIATDSTQLERAEPTPERRKMLQLTSMPVAMRGGVGVGVGVGGGHL